MQVQLSLTSIIISLTAIDSPMLEKSRLAPIDLIRVAKHSKIEDESILRDD